MKRWKVYTTLLAVLFSAALVACSAPAPVETPPSQKPAEFEVGPITFEPSVVMVGDSVTLTTTVSNTGDMSGIYTAVLLVNGQESGRQDIPVAPGNSQAITFPLSETVAGNYSLSIGSSSTALTVHNWAPYAIQYNNSDWSQVGIYVSGLNGQIVRFTPPAKAFKIQKIWVATSVLIITTADYDENYATVRIWDKYGDNLLWSQDLPWRSFGGWVEIQVPSVRVNDDFNVEVVTHSNPAVVRYDGIVVFGGNPIDFVDVSPRPTSMPKSTLGHVVIIHFDHNPSYVASPSPLSRPETRSGYSYMGKLIDPGQKRLEGINWLIRVEGESASSD